MRTQFGNIILTSGAALALAAATLIAAVPASANEVGVSISIGQPGFYGRIDLGNAPRPRILYRQPMVVERVRVVEQEPIYLRVPRGHTRNWRRHCGEYNACNRRVYFVHNDWYNNVYAPHYRKRQGHGQNDNGRGRDDRNDRHHDRDHRDHDHSDRDHDRNRRKG